MQPVAGDGYVALRRRHGRQTRAYAPCSTVREVWVRPGHHSTLTTAYRMFMSSWCSWTAGYRRRPAAVGTYLERHASSPHESRGDDNTRANTAHHPVRSVSALATLGQQTRGARRNCRVSHPHTVRRRSSPPIAARFSFVRMATGAPRRVMRVGIRLYSSQERTGLKSMIRPQVRHPRARAIALEPGPPPSTKIS